MKLQIKNRFTGLVAYECELSAEVAGQSYRFQLGFAIKKAVEARADLRNADLRNAVLRDADLRNADLSGADLRNADLRDADLRNADLSGADLSGADLRDADLRNADLSDADLSDIRNDLWDVLLRARHEVPGLLAAVREGRVNGSTYEGDCACLVGTIANVRHEAYDELGNGLTPNSGRPIERFFLAIKKGDTPETSPVSKIVEGWIVEFQRLTAASSREFVA